MQKDNEWAEWDMPESLREFDFSSASYWFIDDENTPKAYFSIKEIYDDWFRE
jgi:hypothetical protein